jgi:hypothetical protein
MDETAGRGTYQAVPARLTMGIFGVSGPHLMSTAMVG